MAEIILNDEMADVPALTEIRSAFASRISEIVAYFVEGNHRSADVNEIADGIRIRNKAERETIYSAIDPYSDGASKRDSQKPLLFRRSAPGTYDFLGFSDDPLALTTKVHSKVPFLKHCYELLELALTQKGEIGVWKQKPLSERLSILHANLIANPQILQMARDRMRRQQDLDSSALSPAPRQPQPRR